MLSILYVIPLCYHFSSSFFILLLFGKDPVTLPVLSSLLFSSIFPFPLFSFCYFYAYFAPVSILSLFLLCPLHSSLCYSYSYSWFVVLRPDPTSFSIYLFFFYFVFLFILLSILPVNLYYFCPQNRGILFYSLCFCCLTL